MEWKINSQREDDANFFEDKIVPVYIASQTQLHHMRVQK